MCVKSLKQRSAQGIALRMAVKRPPTSHRDKAIPERPLQKQPSAPDGDARSTNTSISHPAATYDNSRASEDLAIIFGHLPEALANKLQLYANNAARESSPAVLRNRARILSRQGNRNGRSQDLLIPSQVWDFKEKYARVMITVSPQIGYVLDKLGVLSYNPFYLPGVFDMFKSNRTISESWYYTGVAIEHVQKGKNTSPALLSQHAKGCQAINQSLGSLERGPVKKWAETRAILSMAFVAVGF